MMNMFLSARPHIMVFGVAILLSIFTAGEEFWEEYIEEFKNMYGDVYPDL